MYHFFFFILCLFAFNEIEVVSIPPGVSDINSICRFKCRQCVCATYENLPYLAEILRINRVSQAAVCGWNGRPGNYVVQDNCKVRCYGSDTLGIEYVLCYRQGYSPRCDPCLPRPYYNRPYYCRPSYCRPSYIQRPELYLREFPGDSDPLLVGNGQLLEDTRSQDDLLR